MYLQALEYKERNFLDLNNNNNQPIQPTYTKGGTWLKHFRLLNLLCTHITRLVTNYALIGKYRLRFFSKGSMACLCREYPIEMRKHIFYEYSQYKKF